MYTMYRCFAIAILLIAATGVGQAQTFSETKMIDAKGKEGRVTLEFDKTGKRKPPMDLVLFMLKESGYQVRRGEVYFDQNTHLSLSDIVNESSVDPIDLSGDGRVEYILYPHPSPLSGCIKIYRKSKQGYQSLWDEKRSCGWPLLASDLHNDNALLHEQIVQINVPTKGTKGYSDLLVQDGFSGRKLAILRFDGRRYQSVWELAGRAVRPQLLAGLVAKTRLRGSCQHTVECPDYIAARLIRKVALARPW